MPPSDAPPDLSGLLELSRIEHLDLKPVILRVQTDLFLRAEGRAEREIFESLACGLIPTVDEDTARIVAEKLSPFPGTPPSVLEALVARGGAIRDAVLAGVPDPTPGLIGAALAGGAQVGADLVAGLAARPGLDRETVEALSDDGRPEVDRTLAANVGVALRGAALRALVGRGRGEPTLARLLLARPDVSAGDLAPLYLHADPLRREAIGRAVEAVAALRTLPPPPRGLGAALTGLSAARDVPAFVAVLAGGLGLPPDFLAAVDGPDARYDLLTLALRAAGLQEEEAVYVFLTLNRGVARSNERVSALVRLFRAVTRAAARDLVAAILDRPLAERAASEAHQPFHGPEARPRPGAGHGLPQRPGLPARALRTGRDGG